jgi:hypothetical protein
VKELIALAKARPGELLTPRPGGSTAHLAGELPKDVSRHQPVRMPTKARPCADRSHRRSRPRDVRIHGRRAAVCPRRQVRALAVSSAKAPAGIAATTDDAGGRRRRLRGERLHVGSLRLAARQTTPWRC